MHVGNHSESFKPIQCEHMLPEFASIVNHSESLIAFQVIIHKVNTIIDMENPSLSDNSFTLHIQRS